MSLLGHSSRNSNSCVNPQPAPRTDPTVITLLLSLFSVSSLPLFTPHQRKSQKSPTVNPVSNKLLCHCRFTRTRKTQFYKNQLAATHVKYQTNAAQQTDTYKCTRTTALWLDASTSQSIAVYIHVGSDSRMSANWKLSVWHVRLHWIRTIFPSLRHYLYRGVERIDEKLPHMVRKHLRSWWQASDFGRTGRMWFKIKQEIIIGL